ncbi:MAG TPA: hypothetical protein VML55_13715 [Planctomycetaceae bacterium]|nr:hypothetical protein [Planctomycetaceae bacterium]
MWNRREHFREVIEVLSRWDGNRQLLIGAAHEYWAAAFEPEEWPEPLRTSHVRICTLIFNKGNIRASIEALDEPAAHLAAADLLTLANAGLNRSSRRPHVAV